MCRVSCEGKSSLIFQSVPDWKIWKLATQHHRAAPDPLDQVISGTHQSQPCPSLFPVLTEPIRLHALFVSGESKSDSHLSALWMHHNNSIWIKSEGETKRRYGQHSKKRGMVRVWNWKTGVLQKCSSLVSFISAPYWSAFTDPNKLATLKSPRFVLFKE